jgi:hypothetical protein
MSFYGKGINDSKDFTTNGKIKSLILDVKDIDKVDNLAINLSRISMILRFYYVNNEFSSKCLMSRTSRTLKDRRKKLFSWEMKQNGQ